MLKACTSTTLYFQTFVRFRGKGDGNRLGQGSEDHVRHPKMIEAFYGKRVVDIAVGSIHCLAVTEEGEVYSWGRNDQGQLGDTTTSTTRPEPILVPGLENKGLMRVAAGPAQVSNKLCVISLPKGCGFWCNS